MTCSGCPLEALAQHGVLRRDPNRAGVEVTLAHHDAAGGNQRRCGKTEFVGAEQGADHHVAACPDAAVDLHRNAAAQAIDDQRLMRFGEADFPGAARVFDRGERARSRAAFKTGDGDGIRARTTRSDCADADLRHQLRDVAGRVDVLEVEDELG